MKIHILSFIFILCSHLAFAQLKIKGKVMSAKTKQPLQGALIRLKGSEIKASSDEHGLFEIKTLRKENTLSISFIGYQSTDLNVMAVVDSPQLNILLHESTTVLNEVIVSTGYQTLPKERATGSFSQLDNKRLNEQVGTNILDRLPAIANSYAVTSPRTNPNGYITVRGFSTLTGPRNPLIIIDNFPYEGDINNLNPNDVENITFLKDAAASSIWGTRAGNGVIVITTKKGKLNQPAKVEFSSNISVLDKPDLFANRNISGSDYIDVEKILFANKYRFSDTASLSHPSFSPVYEILFREAKGTISNTVANQQIDALRSRDVRNDFMRYIYQNGFSQQHAINVKGGSANITWLISGGYDRNINQLNEKYDRLNLRTENTYKLSDRIQFSAGLYYTQSKSLSGKPSYGSISNGNVVIPPYSMLADESGSTLPIFKRRQSYIETAGGGKLLDWNYYPLEDYKHSVNSAAIQDLLATAGIWCKVTDGLTADVKYQYERQNNKNRLAQDAQSYYARDLINNFSQINATTGTVTHKVPNGGILDLTDNTMQAYNFRGQLNYNRTFSDHGISLLAGSEIRQKKADINTYRTYGLNDDLLTIVPVDFANPYTQYTTGNNAFIPNTANFEKTMIRYLSVFGNVAYTYKSKYIFSASARRDASNTFGVATNDKWTPLWSGGFSWNISNEKFYKFDFIPYLKIRTTYGYSGNVDPSKTAVTTIKYSSTSPYTLTPITDVDKFYNPDLRWEKVGMFNIGADFRFIGNRVSGSIEYFSKKSTDLYGTVPLDLTVGLRTPTITKNAAEIKGDGIDVEMNSENLKGIVKWSTNLNLSVYNDKVTKSYTPSHVGNNFVGGGLLALEGKPLYSLFAYKWMGLNPANGNPIGYINGHASENYSAITGDSTQLSDLIYKGSLIPTLYGSMGNTVRWKNISLTARVSYAFGHYFRKESVNYSGLVSSGIGHSDFALRWKNPGDESTTSVPSWLYPLNSNRDAFYQYSELLVLKADNIRLQYLNVAYDLNNRYCKQLGISGIKFFCTVSNLGIIWRANKENLDPDYPNNFSQPSRTISFGINAGL
jgi:TonB-linked SusC/RagA family outer membrane protein